MDNSLPGTSVNDQNQPAGTPSENMFAGSANKEIETNPQVIENVGVVDRAAELDLPKEVVKSGVISIPQIVKVPTHLEGSGVAASGVNAPLGSGDSIALPLTDVEIIGGLSQDSTKSIKWLAEWCVRRLKILHVSLKNLRGKIVRSKIN
jgi:hypothetical protein